MVGGWGFNASEKYEFVNWDDDYSECVGKQNSCSKPPISFFSQSKKCWISGGYPLVSSNRSGWKINWMEVSFARKITDFYGPFSSKPCWLSGGYIMIYIYIYISSRSTSNMLESCDRRSRSLNMGPNSSKKGQNCSRSFWGHFKIRG